MEACKRLFQGLAGTRLADLGAPPPSGGIEVNSQAGVPDTMYEEVSTAEASATPEGAAENEEAGQPERDARGERETKGSDKQMWPHSKPFQL